MGEIVLADTSPIIYLAQIGRISWLRDIFGYVAITSAVRRELLPARDVRGKPAIEEAVRDRILREIEDKWSVPAFSALDEGEDSTIRVAVNLSRRGHHCHVLIDDKQARRALQSLASQNLDFAGTAAVVVRAKRLGLVNSVASELEKLRALGFRLGDDVARSILESVGEGSEVWPPPAKPEIPPESHRRRR